MYFANTAISRDNFKQAKAKFESKLYKVSVPYLATLSETEMKLYGVYQSGNKDVDKGLYGQMTNVYISSKDILEYFKNGSTIKLCVADDIKDIYLTIQEYLEAWKLTLTHSVNQMEAPSKDLVELDNLATEIFGRAKYYFGSGETQSILSNYLTEVNRLHVNNFFESSVAKVVGSQDNVASNVPGAVTINAIDDIAATERDTLSDLFKKKLAENSRFRK